MIREVPGGAELIAWFGFVPRFHDANLLEIELRSKSESRLRIHAWRMTNVVDEEGYYVLDKHAVVTITLHRVTSVDLSDFSKPGIIAGLELTKTNGAFDLKWDGSYGVDGSIQAEQISFRLEPGKPSD